LKALTMSAAARRALRSQGETAHWLQRLTVAGSLFFFVKGLAWLAAGY
jgi:DMSO reductase anchor subunit